MHESANYFVCFVVAIYALHIFLIRNIPIFPAQRLNSRMMRIEKHDNHNVA